MKRLVLVMALGSAAGMGFAQDLGRVLSSTALINQVSLPRQVCSNETVQLTSQSSGGGAVLGAVAGGAVGNAIGQGSGRAAATLLGIVGGAMLGDRIEGPGSVQNQNIQRCSLVNMTENRVTGYQVVYEYAGKQYSVQMPYDPGPTVRLQVAPVDATPQPSAAAPPVTLIQPAPAQVIYSQTFFVPVAPLWVPAYPAYAYRPAPSINLQFGYGSYRHGHSR
ncbi:MAG: glycine zipper 2TM domain-containing protein [Rhodoferax sp.]|nr:glycine zipper 2TM domain-containing protein [Rhodoferax sp.]